MLLRKMRWLCAGLLATVAMLAAPSRSMADTQILIQELDGSGNPVGASQITTGSGTFVFASGISTTNFTGIQVITASGSGAIGSLSSSVTAGLSSTFDPSHSLQVIVTSDGYVNPFPGQPAVATNTAGAQTGIVGGTNIITGNTALLSDPLTSGADQAATPATGTAIAGPTSDSTASFNLSTGGVSGTKTTASNSALPDTYAVQQTIIIRATPDSTGSILTGSTVGGTVGTTVQTNAAPVPAPAGLILALAAVPMFGLRRALRRKVAETTV